MSTIGKSNIVYHSNYPWSNRFSRYTNLALALSRDASVDSLVFVEPPLTIGDLVQDVRVMIRRLSCIGGYRSTRDYPLHVRSIVSPIPFQRLSFLRKRGETWSERAIGKLAEQVPIDNRILVLQGPSDYTLRMLSIFKRAGFFTVFDWADLYEEHAGSDVAKEATARICRAMSAEADVVVAVSPKIRDLAGSANPRSYALLDAVWAEHVLREPNPPRSLDERTRRPRIGYFGLMNRFKLDCVLIKQIVEMRPDWEFVFVGSQQDDVLASGLGRAQNIRLIPEMDGQSLHRYVAEKMDLVLLPYNASDRANRACSPLKLFESLGLGLPVVSTDSFDPLDARELISIGTSAAALVDAMERELSADSVLQRAARLAYARQNTWEIRARQLMRIIESERGHTASSA